MEKVENNKDPKFDGEKRQSKTSRFSIFIISETIFGIELENVTEVITFPKISKVPAAPKHTIGVFSLRGTILTLFKIDQIVGIDQPMSDEKMVLIIEHKDQQMGILVEKVLDVINVEESDIKLPSREMSPKMAKNVIGLYDKEGMGTINLLDLNKLFLS